MSKLTVFVDLGHTLIEDAAMNLICRPGSADISERAGERLLIADVGLTAIAGGYLAHGRLGAGSIGGLMRIEDIRMFIREVSFTEILPSPGTVSETDDDVFQQIMTAGTQSTGNAEEATPFIPAPTKQSYAMELARLRQRRCSFSGVTTYNGDLFAIQPGAERDAQSTALHLFLDAEAGELFLRFAWSVGSRFEILINTGATGGHFAQTVNDRGVLDISERPAFWPDRQALAWHRRQFLDRLSG